MSVSIVTSTAFLPVVSGVSFVLVALALILGFSRRSIEFPAWLKSAAPVIGTPLSFAGLVVLFRPVRSSRDSACWWVREHRGRQSRPTSGRAITRVRPESNGE
ncbi:MAG: hypothetical protein WBW04_06310 [Nitrolancea sp.]